MAFNILPIELNQSIATFIEDDRDLVSFRATCQQTRNALDGDRHSFWRSRYKQHFDLAPGQTSEQLKRDYQHRVMHLQSRRQKAAKFFRGSRNEDRFLLNIIKDLIVESFKGSPKVTLGMPVSKNLELLKRISHHTPIIKLFRRPEPFTTWTKHNDAKESPLVQVVQLLLTHLCLKIVDTPMADFNCFELSQKMAYTSAEREPIFKKSGSMNYKWMRHTVNFFRYHFNGNKDDTTASALPYFLSRLAEDELPSAWTGELQDGMTKLDRYWKGTYAYQEFSQLREMRRSEAGIEGLDDGHLADDEEVKDPIQTLALDFAEVGDEIYWPNLFDEYIKTGHKDHKQKNRPQTQHCTQTSESNSLYFEGHGTDDEEFLSAGWLSPLPPQQGIPGWKRMAMMKYYRCEHTGAVDVEALWAYEGVVLPGGKIIIGRWWAPGSMLDGESYSGPFILWNVATPKSERADSVMSG